MSDEKESMGVELSRIEELPDYAALRQVRDALWKLGDVHGAATMIGAGFSRFARVMAATTPQPPLWGTFRDVMLQDLYPDGGGPSDPLSLAEEYRSTLGFGALEGLIRTLVRDAEWEPGVLHKNLLRLPWSDVLTTNWDTLLERSADLDPDTSYDVVRVTADVARARRPRIVKLHGSMPSHLPFIFTEEDFRTYPERFAPFVNLAQQVLLENELCLLGFSGEDPNFLKWAGWVRDKLGAAARPIRLVGVLDLAPSRRRLFEARNITPIDLSPLVQGVPREDRHHRAMEIFLKYLWEARPSANVEWEWISEKEYNLSDDLDADAKLTLLTNIWRDDRERHPGWLVTPYHQRYRARFATQDVLRLLAKELPNVSPAVRAGMVFETVWRLDTLFWSALHGLEEIADMVMSSEEDVALPLEHRTLLNSALIRVARQRRDWSSFEKRVERLNSIHIEDAQCVYFYEKCLRARDELDYKYISENSHRIDGHDPIWSLRRAALQAEILETKSAARSIQSAYKEIRRRRAQDRQSLWLLSREAWASFLMQSARFELRDDGLIDDRPDWPLAYKAAGTDPWDELNSISDELERAAQQSRADALDRQPQFDPGHYRINSGTRIVNAAVPQPFEQYSYLEEHVGLPQRLGHTTITGARWAVAISNTDNDNLPWLALRSIISHDYDLLEEHFSRLAVARLQMEVVEQMVTCLRRAIAYGRDQIGRDDEQLGDWAARLNVLCELLSRLSVRLDGDQAIECFRLGAALLKDPAIRHWWVLKGIGNLLTRSIQALQPERRHEVALDVLYLPLPNEAKFGGIERDFPDASSLLNISDWKCRENNFRWNSRIAHYLDQSKGTDADARRHSIFRLLSLFEADVLTESEKTEFGQGLWLSAEPGQPAAETMLLPHVFLQLPSPDPNLPAENFMEVVQRVANGSYELDLLNSLHSASYLRRNEGSPYPLDAKTAQAIFENLLNWQPKAIDRRSIVRFNAARENEAIELAIARVLSSAILPSIDIKALESPGCEKIFARITDGSMPSLLQSLPALIARNSSHAERAYKAIRTGLLGGGAAPVLAALAAIYALTERWENDGTPIPETLVSEVVTLCFMRREPGLVSALTVATRLVKSQAVPDGERGRLVNGVELIRTETSYDKWEDQSRRSDVGLIRRGAVQLCNALKEAGETAIILDEWLSDVGSDPMPEVRYALREND